MAVVYRGTVSSFYRTNNLLNFYNNVVDGNSIGNSMYLVVGRKEPWATNENDVGFAPPYPYDEPAGYADVWARSIGFVKINESNTVAIYPRRDWGDPTIDNVFQIGDIVCTNTANYNHSTGSGVDAGIMVYKCVDIPNQGECSIDNIEENNNATAKETCIGLGGSWFGTSAFDIPTGKGLAVKTDDDYTWEYMYTIPPASVISDVSDDYIPVPFPSDIESDPANWGLEAAITENMDQNRTIYNVKANLLRFKIPLSVSQFPALADPAGTGFRQLSIVQNPILVKTLYNEPSVVAQDDFYVAPALQFNSGEIIYMENRQPIYKSTYQEELVTITFSF